MDKTILNSDFLQNTVEDKKEALRRRSGERCDDNYLPSLLM